MSNINIKALRSDLVLRDEIAGFFPAFRAESKKRLTKGIAQRSEVTKRIMDAMPSLLDEIERLRAENERLRALLPAAWDAGAARMLASHKEFKQTHPTRSEWLNEALRGGDA